MKKTLIFFFCILIAMVHAETKIVPPIKALPKDNAKVDFLLGELALNRKLYPQAEYFFGVLSDKYPSNEVLERQIQLLINNKKYTKAIPILKRLIEVAPDNIEARFYLAKSYHESKQPELTVGVLNSIAHYFTEKGGNGFSGVYQGSYDWLTHKELISVFKKLVVLNPNSVDAKNLYAGLLIDDNQSDKAIPILNSAIQDKPDQVLSYSLLSYALFKENQPNIALLSLKVAAEKFQKIEFEIEYLNALENDFQILEAKKYVDMLLKKYPKESKLWEKSTVLNYLIGDSATAKQSMNRVIDLKGDFISVAFDLANYSRDVGKYSDFLKVVPDINHPEIVQLRLISIANQSLIDKKYGDFLNIFDELRAQFPDKIDYFYVQQLDMLQKANENDKTLYLAKFMNDALSQKQFLYTYYEGMSYFQKKDYEKMVQTFGDWLKNHPKDASALNTYGYMLLEISPKNSDNALKYLIQANKYQPNDPAIMDSVGWAYLKEGDLEKANQYLVKAYNQMKQPDVIAHYIELLIAQGKIKEAEELFKRLMQVYSNHIETMKLTQLHPGFLK